MDRIHSHHAAPTICVTGMQDPIVFSGTVRYNLNPFGGGAADVDMWAALQQAGLKDTVSSLAVGLLHDLKMHSCWAKSSRAHVAGHCHHPSLAENCQTSTA